MRIDHVIYAAADLDAAAARIESELGLVVAGGGRHAGLGTHNRIVPLGGGYLELIAVCDPEEAAGSPLGAAVSRRVAGVGDGLLGWVVTVADVEPHAARLGVAVSTIARAGLTARLAGLADAMADPLLPFFIARDAGVADPGEGSDAGGIERIELSGDRETLREWLGGADLPVRIEPGPGAVRALRIGGGRTIHGDGRMEVG